MSAPDPVQEFLYLLMRDELPAGRVMRIVQQVEELRRRGCDAAFSSTHLAAHAAELADRILGRGETMEFQALREAVTEELPVHEGLSQHARRRPGTRGER